MNNAHPQLIDTRSATIELVESGMVEIRFKPDVKLDLEGMGEVVRAKRALCHSEERDVLAILPHDVDFELNVLSVDHHLVNGGCGLARRLALAAQSPFNERLANIYFRYHPRENETAVFLEETDARKWLTTSALHSLS